MTVTADDLTFATMKMTLALDGDYYHNQYKCVEYPELTQLKTGPSNRKIKGGHAVKLFVDGVEVPLDLHAVADAINAYRATKAGPS